jgi:hypothetical protein
VGTSAETTVTLDTNVSMSSISQPLPTTNLSWHTNTNLAGYVVYGIKGEIAPTSWVQRGGSVRVSIDPENDTRVIVTVRGANGTDGPYRIATQLSNPDTDADYDGEIADPPEAGSLRLQGTGTRFNQQVVRGDTGADPRYITDDQAVTIDSRAISTLDQAWEAFARVAASVNGPQQIVKVGTTGINRRGQNNTGRYLTMDEFNTENGTVTFDQFNAKWTGKTFNDFNARYATQFSADFETQAYGNVAGARVHITDAMYRIRDATVTPEGIEYTAERDTIMEDFNAVWSGASFDDFNAAYAGMTMDDFNVMPLHR